MTTLARMLARWLFVLAVLVPVAGWATDTYVSTSGNNSNACGAGAASPKRTIGNAINNCGGAGNTIFIANGVYDEVLHHYGGTSWPNNVTAANPFRLIGASRDNTIIRPSDSTVGSLGQIIYITDATGSYSPGTVKSNYIFDSLTIDGSLVTSQSINGMRFDAGTQFFTVNNVHIIGNWPAVSPSTGNNGCGIQAGGDSLNNPPSAVQGHTVTNSEINNFASYGSYIGGVNGWTFDRMDYHDNGAYAIHYYGNAEQGSFGSGTIKNSYFHHNGGFYCGSFTCGDDTCAILAGNSSAGHRIYNNLIVDHQAVGSLGGCGITVSSFLSYVYNNTIVGNSGYCLQTGDFAGGATFQNNLCYANARGDLNNNGASTVFDHNNPNSVNPRFVDPPNGNYRLQTSSPRSPALDAGLNLSSTFTGDITGTVTRPATGNWDLGAYEMEAGGSGGLIPEKGTFFIDDTGTPNTTDCHAATGTVGSPSASPFGDYATARICMQPGSTLYFRAGTYPPLDTNVTPFAGGTSTEPTTLAAYPGETVTLQATGGSPVVFFHNSTTDHFIILQGLILDGQNINGTNGFAAYPGVNDIRLDGVEIKNTYFEGVFLQQTSNIALRNGTKVHNSAFASVGVVGLDRTTNTLITGSEVYASGGPGISSYGGNSNLIIERSTIRNTPAGKGILLGNASNPDSGVQIANSLIYTNTHGIHLQNGTTGAKLYYNTLWNNSTACMLFDSGVTVSEAINNICWQVATLTNNAGSGMTLVTNQTTDPSFVSTTSGDPNFLRLGATSTARDSGTPIASLTTDLTGKNRPDGTQVDRGAYEEVPPPPAPVQLGLVPPFRTTFFLVPLP